MPVVPFSSTPSGAPQPKPDDPFILMAGATMAAERQPPLVKSSGNVPTISNPKS